ncbi:XrtA/PEP-CTERM system-associated ATPase [Altererythrobacter sp. Root672]|uniref:XrtA/PEP-CTERM system-associated ATPase n=1 Tax=Altererythrobacter sp. Root672 TaxID=1736584 RepID=UPI0006F5E948|nr:XrtA/PEP-CTERM system-associated ATPase [Altererythrobacter sp. Root672]KRA83499.1 general secretion pathway protein [Altererythrobacter sp. Root672]
MFAEFYGLTGKPFQLTPDPAFYFRSVTHRKALSYLGYGLAQGEGFMVITGEVGAGKSTLVAHLMGSVDPSQLSVAQIVTSKLDEEEIIHVVAQSFGLEIEGHDKASALGAIEGFLHDEARAGRRCLLIVDESQNLSVSALEELRMLSNFQLGNHPLLQTLLLGQPEFRSTLQGHESLEQLRQRVIAAHHLEAMEEDEVEPYIAHRLKTVGWNGNPQFDEAVFAELYEASGGIPRRVNQIANRLLLLGAVEQSTRIDTTMLRTVVAEMEGERTFAEVPTAAAPEPEHLPEPVAVAPVAPKADMSVFEAQLAVRDAQIVELQDAVIELATHLKSATETSSTPDVAALKDQMARMEARLLEQEQAVRQTLGMLIEWMEAEMDQARAA